MWRRKGMLFAKYFKQFTNKSNYTESIAEPVDIVVDSPTDQPVKEENNLGQKGKGIDNCIEF